MNAAKLKLNLQMKDSLCCVLEFAQQLLERRLELLQVRSAQHAVNKRRFLLLQHPSEDFQSQWKLKSRRKRVISGRHSATSSAQPAEPQREMGNGNCENKPQNADKTCAADVKNQDQNKVKSKM